MKIYRVQRVKDNLGPFFEGTNLYNRNKKTYLKHDPEMAFCGVSCARHWNVDIYKKHHWLRICGCESLKDIKSWFPCKQGREAMEEGGFGLFEYTISKRKIFDGYKQLTFVEKETSKCVRLSLRNLKEMV